MNQIQSVLKSAARRIHLEAFLLSVHQVLIVLGILAIAVVLASKTTVAVSVPWLWVSIGAGAIGLIVALVIWSTHRRSEMQIAVAVDEKLDLREKLSTALHLRGRDDSFARAAVEDAVTVAADGRTMEQVRRHFKVQGPNRWYAGPMMIAIAVAAGLFVPQSDWFSRDDEQPGLTAIPADVQQVLTSAVEQAKKSNLNDEEIQKLMEELDPAAFDPKALKSPDDAKREALKRLTSLQDRMQEMLETPEAKQTEILQKQLKQLQPFDEGPGKELSEALNNGDFQAAQKALEELQKQMDAGQLSPEQQKQLEEQMNQLAEQLQQMANQQRELEKALQQAGMDKNLAQNPQALQQAIQNNQNLNQQQKQQLQQMAQAQQMANGMCQNLGNALGQMAQQMAQGGGQGGQGQQGAQNAQQMLNQMEAMQQMMREAQAMANSLGGMCQGLGQGLGQGMGQSLAQGQGAFGGMGRGQGGQAPKAATPTRTKLEQAQTKQSNADVIASMLFDGPQIKGESRAAFQEAVRSAEQSYAENVEENQVPRQYHEAIKHFYGENGLGGKSKTSSSSSSTTGTESGGTESSSSGGSSTESGSSGGE